CYPPRPMTDAPLTMLRVFRFWLPLAATWLMMAVEGPLLAAIIARLPEPTYNLAAYGVAFSLALVAEAPVIMIMSAATALARDRLSYLRLRNFTLVLSAGVTIVMAVALAPPFYDWLARDLIGLPDEVASRTYIALVILLPWPGTIGLRRLFQGVLIRAGLTRRVALGTVIRLATMTATATLLFRMGGVEGAWLGAAALTVGVSCEAIACRLMTQGALRRLLATNEGPTGATTSYRALSRFYYPLALTALLSLGIHPVVTFFIGNSRASLESLAVLPVVGALVFIFRSIGLAYQEVVIALVGENQEGYAVLRRFALLLSVAVIAGLGLIAWTPLAGVWFHVVSGLPDELARFALGPTQILAIMPGLTALLSFQRAIMVVRNSTTGITWATLIEVIGVVAVLWIAIAHLDVVGAIAAAAALLLGRIGANLSLIPALKA
ncbi:MAG: hypothetical protein ACC742_08190, partial [Thermoanaerobaculales bacterium]